jgi:hypothetical protein
MTSKTLLDSEGVTAVKDNCSAVIGLAANQDTELSLAQSSNSKGPECFMAYPNAGQHSTKILIKKLQLQQTSQRIL